MDKIKGMSGRIIGHYKLVRPIKSGGMKDVYEAVHQDEISTKFALYILKAELMQDPSYQRRFEREARALSMVRHENVIQIFDVLKESGVQAIVTEYIEGEMTLSQLVHKHGKLPQKRALDIFEQIGRALSYVHSLKILHRDIKPSNIMLTPDEIVKLIDFGIAVGSRGDGSQAVSGIGIPGDETSTGVFIGTLDFASPEQMMAQRGLDERTDIYSLGALFFYMLTGVLPFGEDRSRDSLSSVREFNSRLSPELSKAIAKSLSMKRDERYQSIEEFTEAVARCPESGWSEFERAYQRAEELYRQGIFTEALVEWEGSQELLQKILVRDPDSTEAREQLKIVASRMGELKKSEEANILYRKALEFSKAGVPEEAARCLEEVVSLDPQRLDARRLLSYLQKSLTKEEIEPDKRQRLKQEEKTRSFNIARQQATELFHKRNYKECLTDVDKALAINPDDQEMVPLKRQCETRLEVVKAEKDITGLLDKGRSQEARQRVTTIYAGDPNAAETWLVRINAAEKALGHKRAAHIRRRKLYLRGAMGSVAVGILIVGYLHIIATEELREIRTLYEQAKSNYMLAKKYIPGFQSLRIEPAGKMIALGESLTREQRRALRQDLLKAADLANVEGMAKVKEKGEKFHRDLKVILGDEPLEWKLLEEKKSTLAAAKNLIQADREYTELQKKWRNVFEELRESWKDRLRKEMANIEKRHPRGVARHHPQWDRIRQDINNFIAARIVEAKDLLPVARKKAEDFKKLKSELGQIESEDVKVLAEIKRKANEYEKRVRLYVENVNTDSDLLAKMRKDVIVLNDKGFLDRYGQLSEKSSELRNRLVALSQELSRASKGEFLDLHQMYARITRLENEISTVGREILGLREQLSTLEKGVGQLVEVRQEADLAYRTGHDSYRRAKEKHNDIMKKAEGRNFDEQRQLGAVYQELLLSWKELENRHKSQRWESDWSDLRDKVEKSAQKVFTTANKLSERIRKEAGLTLFRMAQDIEAYEPLIELSGDDARIKGIKEGLKQLKYLRSQAEELGEGARYREVWEKDKLFLEEQGKISKKAADIANQDYTEARTIYQDTKKLVRAAAKAMPEWKVPFSELQKLEESFSDLEYASNNKQYVKVIAISHSLLNASQELTQKIDKEVLSPKRNKLKESLQKAAEAYENAKERLSWKFDFFNLHRHYGRTFAEWVKHPSHRNVKERERILVANWRKVREISADDLKNPLTAYEMMGELDQIKEWIALCRLVWESAENALKAGVTIKNVDGRRIIFNEQLLEKGERRFDPNKRQWLYRTIIAVNVKNEEEAFEIGVAGRGKVGEVTLRPGEHRTIKIHDRVEIFMVEF